MKGALSNKKLWGKMVKDWQNVKIVAIAILLVLSAHLGLLLAFPISKVSPLWPPSGIALALLVLMGYKTWPGVTIGYLIINSLVFWNNQIDFSIDSISASTIMALGGTAEALLGYFLFTKFISNQTIKCAKKVFIFLFIALLMCLVGSIIHNLSLSTYGIIEGDSLFSLIFLRWVGNTVSVLAITPFILSWAQKFELGFNRQGILEILVFAGALAFVVWLMEFDQIATTVEKSLPYLIIPFLLWLAFKFNLQITTSGVLVVSVLAVYFTVHGQGPFVLDSEYNSMLILRVFIAVTGISAIVLSATVTERREAQIALQKFNENLEVKVAERTKKLNEEITNRKKFETKIKLSNKKLRKANVELDNFVYSVSHDLRSPIASVLGLVNIAKKEKSLPAVKQHLDMIAQSAERQDLFIKDILDLSRNSRLELSREEIHFKEMIDEIFGQLKYNSAGKNIDKEINIAQPIPFTCDLRRLKVIFNNLISNSIRYSNGRKPHIKVDVVVSEKLATIEVEDNGIGISEKHLPKVFEMFYRATDDNAGSGLGLYIVKETMDKLNGKIEINSQENSGTKIHLEIPGIN